MNRVFCTHCPSECDVNWSKDLLIKPPVCLLATTPHRWRIDYYSNIRGNSFVMSKGRMPTWVWNKLCLVRETSGAPISQYWSTSSHRRPGSGLASGHIWELISILSNTHTVASKLIFGKWQELVYCRSSSAIFDGLLKKFKDCDVNDHCPRLHM